MIINSIAQQNMSPLELDEMIQDISTDHGVEYDWDRDSDAEEEDDDESIFSSGGTCSTMGSSVLNTDPSSEVSNYRYENTRRYHAYRDGRYVFPNDEREQDRMAIFDQMMNLLFDGELHLSPLSQPRRILDIGTGTGVWASDMAYKFPNARIIGTDLSPIQVPPPDNCTFEVEDAESDWVYPPNYFSMIHVRQILVGIENWRKLIGQGYKHLHPGGWMEIHETPVCQMSENPDRPDDYPLLQGERLFNEAMTRVGRNTKDEPYKFKGYMKEAGFVDIEETIIRIPLGPWMADTKMKQVGRYNMLNFLEGIHGFLIAPATRIMRMSVDETQALIDRCQKDILNKRMKLYYNLVVVRGRKPAACETQS